MPNASELAQDRLAYFPHDSNASNDIKCQRLIRRLGWSGYGRWWRVCELLASNKGRVFTKKQIYTQVWAEEYAFDDSNIMSFISKLRKKIEPNPEQPFYIQTVRGVGYRFNKEV